MSVSITIAGHGARIELNVMGYERDNAPNGHDANWLTCLLNFEIGAFSGATALSIQTNDLARFNDQIGLLVQGENAQAAIKPVEEVLECTITMATLGHALISGTIKHLTPWKPSCHSRSTATYRSLDKLTWMSNVRPKNIL